MEYCFRVDGEVVTVTMTSAEKDKGTLDYDQVVLPDGRIGVRDYAAEAQARKLSGRKNVAPEWPVHSDAAGVHPDDAPAAQAESTRRGVPTEFHPETGCAIFRSRGHRTKYCRAFGYFDRDGGYRDAQRR